MQITIFSVWMTFVWCSIFIVLCYILRKRSVLLNLSSMTGIIILYLFCLIRLVVPVELPWTKVVSGGSLYNFLYQIFGCEITCVAGHEIYVYHIFVVAWGVVMAVLLTRYLIQYHRVVSYFSEMEKTEDTELNNILDEICTDKEKRNIKIVQTAAVEVPCCIGIFEKRILIPDKKYSREELHYIILHEYTHLDNKDILTIQLINILCIVFWWNPFVYILKGDMSLVGPRPERPQFVEKFKEEIPRYMIKHQVRPGLTGWAQVNGYRGDTSIRKRIEYDLYYIENWTLGFDFKIIFLTFFKGFINKNAY